ncbi:MAG: elongation factor 4, partial [Patescibacteria group bacterium]
VSFYPEDTNKYDDLKQALAKLRLTDAALKFEPDFSEVLGRGFKGGFLGRLHFEITAERLEREFKISTVHSFPSVAYKVKFGKDWQIITNPKDFPDEYLETQEPITKIEIVSRPQYLGAILGLKEIFRFSEIETKTLNDKVVVSVKLPLSDLIRDLDDKLKSVTQGFASFSYGITGYEKTEVAKLEILVATHSVPGLTRILPKEDIEKEARVTVEKLKDLLPKQQFTQALQAVSRGRIIARETIPAARKELGNFGKTGGDRTRKMKLWKKQQRGKERLKERGESTQIKIPAHVFKELLKK